MMEIYATEQRNTELGTGYGGDTTLRVTNILTVTNRHIYNMAVKIDFNKRAVTACRELGEGPVFDIALRPHDAGEGSI